MLLIVGGEGSGKRSFVKTVLGYSETDMADAVLDGCPVIFHLEQLVFRSPDRTDDYLKALEGKEVIICNEVGSGVIPTERRERIGREATGRLCVLLAQRADCVVRMISGLPMVIKGELPCTSL